MRICFKCGKTEAETVMLTHHTKYFPEEIVDCCNSCHQKIHKRLRKENKCSLSVSEIRKLSIDSNHRRRKGDKKVLDYSKQYYQNHKDHQLKYPKENTRRICFSDVLEPNTQLLEAIYVNDTTGYVSYYSEFHCCHGYHLFRTKECL
jgi:hypothetical protein